LSRKRNELKKTISEHLKDKYSRFVRPQIINPTKTTPDIPFDKIKNSKERAVLILWIAKTKIEEIAIMLNLRKSTVYYYISNAYRYYPSAKSYK